MITGRAEDSKGLWAILRTIFSTALHLPPRIAATCRIWFFAWIGWFPFLFYSSTFVGEVLQRYDTTISLQKSDDLLGDIARVGSMALLIHSSISLLASFTLPWLVHSPESEILRKSRSRQGILYGVLEFFEIYRPSLAMAWFIGHVIFAVALFVTVFIRSVAFATFVVGICGVPWALMNWAPFAFVGEEISKLSGNEHGGVRHGTTSGSVYERLSTDGLGADEEQYVPMMELSRPSLSDAERPSIPAHLAETSDFGSELSGIYLGILNVFACLPQLVATFISFVVFAILEPGKSPEFASEDKDTVTSGDGKGKFDGVNAIAVVLALGGVSVLMAAKETLKFKNM